MSSHTPDAYDKETLNFAQGLDFLRSQVAIHTVFDKESESEVEKCPVLEPGGKNTFFCKHLFFIFEAASGFPEVSGCPREGF